jgi:hypothetical protein
LERAVTLDPLNLAAASTLIGLYQKVGKLTEAAELAAKMQAAMKEGPNADPTPLKGSTDDSRKNAEEVFKNIQVIKGVPTDQLVPTMQFMSSALGVDCSFCHVEGHFEKDDKKPKQTARDMMQMMFALNRTAFNGQREVTCYSCHRGARNPVAIPNVDSELQSNPGTASSEARDLTTSLPTARALIDNYIKALGGTAAIGKITSRVEKGAVIFRGQSVPAEIFTQAPEHQAVVRHFPEGDSVVAFNGHAGWIGIPGRPVREMHGADIQAARMDSDLQFPLHIRQIFPELRVEYPEKIDNRDAYVLFCIRRDQPPVKLYFHEQSGLLVRLVRYVDSPLGLDPSQIDYGDYRDVEGVQVPFRMTLSQPGSSSTIQIDEVRQNVPIDAAKFSRPTSDRSPTASVPSGQAAPSLKFP